MVFLTPPQRGGVPPLLWGVSGTLLTPKFVFKSLQTLLLCLWDWLFLAFLNGETTQKSDFSYPFWSILVKNCRFWSKTIENHSFWFKTHSKWSKWSKIIENGQKSSKMVKKCRFWSKPIETHWDPFETGIRFGDPFGGVQFWPDRKKPHFLLRDLQAKNAFGRPFLGVP